MVFQLMLLSRRDQISAWHLHSYERVVNGAQIVTMLLTLCKRMGHEQGRATHTDFNRLQPTQMFKLMLKQASESVF